MRVRGRAEGRSAGCDHPDTGFDNADGRRKKQVCELAKTAAVNQLFGEALALGDYDDSENEALRGAVSKGYSTLAGQLYSIAVGAPAGLGPVLLRWAAASSEVARYVADHKPGRGNVLEFGPGQARMTAAEKAAEKICGYKLTNICDPKADIRSARIRCKPVEGGVPDEGSCPSSRMSADNSNSAPSGGSRSADRPG